MAHPPESPIGDSAAPAGDDARRRPSDAPRAPKADLGDVAGPLAREHGFDLCGLAPAELSRDRRLDFARWGRSRTWEGMPWLGRHRRFKSRPARIGLADSAGMARPIGTFVVLGLNYRQSEPEPGETWLRAIARYARGGRDYHNIIKKMLKSFGRDLEARVPGIAWRALVDSAPAPEKALAEAAGLGWYGKNTLILNRNLGSYFFLAALATDAPWDPRWRAPAAPDGCRTCRACQDACPTGALDVAYRIDARRCVSAWTIERKEDLDADQLRSLGGNLFGCDLCQSACPFNRRRGAPEAARFALREGWRGLALADAAGWDAARWSAETAGTPLARPGWERLRALLPFV